MNLNPLPKCGEFYTVGENRKDRILVYINPTSPNLVIVPSSGQTMGTAYFENPIKVQSGWAKIYIEQIIETKKMKRNKIKLDLISCGHTERDYLENQKNILSFQIRNLNDFYEMHMCERLKEEICLAVIKPKSGEWYKAYYKSRGGYKVILIDSDNPYLAKSSYYRPMDILNFFGPVLLTKDRARLQLLKELEIISDEIEATPNSSRSPLESIKTEMVEFYKTHFGELRLDS